MEDVLLDYIKEGAEQTLTEKVTETVTDQLIATTEQTVGDTALDVLDLGLESGFLEGAAALLGAPFAIVIGLKALKRFRAKNSGKANS